MSTTVAFLSGKGGSGKTTLALSMADLLSRCGIQTLLVDCDLSTNGATFFYESQLYEWNKNQPHLINSFSDILSWDVAPIEPFPLKIKNKLDFVPSVSKISDQNIPEESVRSGGITKRRLSDFLAWARQHYEVILFDCQAGCSDFLPALLPMMDADLFVLEADSISASSMRNLHLKVGNYFGNARLYQVFNKATSEEFEIYSKIVGTFFTNIGTLLFDWKIRQAFSRSQIPDIGNTSAQYGADLCDICKIIFPDKAVLDKLNSFSVRLRYRQVENECDAVEDKLYELHERRFSDLMEAFFVAFFTAIAFTVALLLSSLFEDKLQAVHLGNDDFRTVLSILVIMGVSVATFFVVYFRCGVYRRGRKERAEYEQKLKKLDKEMARLEKELK